MNKLLFLAAVCISLSGCFVSGGRATPTSSAEKILTLEDKESVETLFDKCRALPKVNAACENEKEEAVFKCWQANLEHSNIFIRYSPPSVEGGLIVRQNEHAEPGWGYFVKEDELYINFQLPHLIKIKQGDMSLLPYAEETNLKNKDLNEFALNRIEGRSQKSFCGTSQEEYVLFEYIEEHRDDGIDTVPTYAVFFVNEKQKLRRQLNSIYVEQPFPWPGYYAFCDAENGYLYFTGCGGKQGCGVLAYNLKTNQITSIKRDNWPAVLVSNPAEIPHTDYFVYTVMRDKEPYSIELYVHRKLKQK